MLFHQIQYQSCPQKVLYFDSSFFLPKSLFIELEGFFDAYFWDDVFFLLNVNFVIFFKSMGQGSTKIFFKQSQLNDQSNKKTQ